MTAQVHIFGPTFSTFVRTVMLCCEEKGISYTTGLKGDALEGKDLRTLHPFGKVPALIHDDLCLFETAPICRYLDNEFTGPTA